MAKQPERLRFIECSVTGEAKEAPTKRRQVLQLAADHILELLDSEPDRMRAALDASTVSEERLTYFEQAANHLGVQVVKVRQPLSYTTPWST